RSSSSPCCGRPPGVSGSAAVAGRCCRFELKAEGPWSAWRIVREHLSDGFADRSFAFGRRRWLAAHDLFAAAAPHQLAVSGVVEVDLQGGDLVVHAARFAERRATPVTAPIATPAATVLGGDLILTFVDDQHALHLEVTIAIGGLAQAALLELFG